MRILKPDKFVEAHERFYVQVRRYMTTGLGRHGLSLAGFPQGWSRRQAISLPAINDRARIAFMEAAVGFFRHYSLTVRPARFYFVTFMPARFAVPLKSPQDFELDQLKEWTAKQVAGLDYLGVIEAALFGNHELPGARGPTVSWHVHMLVWNVPEEKLERIVEAVNRQNKTLLPGLEAGHMRALGREGAISRIVYMLKAPMQEYRIPADLSGHFKGPLRPGMALQVFRLFSGITTLTYWWRGETAFHYGSGLEPGP